MESKIIHRETRYEAHMFNVESVKVRLPDGRNHDYDLVAHNAAVTILPLDNEDNIWFVSQFRVGAEGSLLELPAGVLNEGEAPLEGAAREIREEIGRSAGKLEKIGEFYMAAGYCNEFMHVFLATDLEVDPLSADEDEFLLAESIPVQQVLKMAANGNLKDSKTLAALMLALPYLPKA